MAVLKFDAGWNDEEKKLVACFFSQIGFVNDWVWTFSKRLGYFMTARHHRMSGCLFSLELADLLLAVHAIDAGVLVVEKRKPLWPIY